MRKLGWNKTLAATAGGLAVLAGGGAALAAADGEGRSASFFDAVAQHLGISSQELEDATKAAALEQVDAALEEGRITQEHADELKSRIESGEGPGLFGFRGPGFGHHGFHGDRGGPPVLGLGFGGKLDAAAEFLGIDEADLRERLRNGESLADVAEALGKSVEDLKAALVAGAKERLDEAVAEERLTQERADAILERVEQGVDALVEGELRIERGFRGFHGPPLFGPGAPEEENQEEQEPQPEGTSL